MFWVSTPYYTRHTTLRRRRHRLSVKAQLALNLPQPLLPILNIAQLLLERVNLFLERKVSVRAMR